MKNKTNIRIITIITVLLGASSLMYFSRGFSERQSEHVTENKNFECDKACRKLLEEISKDYKKFEISATSLSDSMVNWRHEIPWNSAIMEQWTNAIVRYDNLRQNIESVRKNRKESMHHLFTRTPLLDKFQSLDENAMITVHQKLRIALNDVKKCYSIASELGVNDQGIAKQKECAESLVNWKTTFNEELVELNLRLNTFQDEISPYLLP